MTVDKLRNRNIRPLRDLLCFKWKPPKLKSGFILPQNFYDLKLQFGKFYIGEVLAIGPKVTQLKTGNNFLIHEYGIKDFRGTWRENEIYFVEEENCSAKMSNFKGIIERPISKKEVERIESS